MQHHKFTALTVLLATAIFSIIFAILIPSPAPAAPSITWTPASVNESVLAGESKIIPVSFIASENLTNAVIRVVPELELFVQVSPNTFVNLTKGQIITLNLTLSSPVNSLPQSHDGTIQLRSRQDARGKNLAKPLPVNLNIVWKKLDDPRLGFSLEHPPSWTTEFNNDGTVDIIGNVTGEPRPKVAGSMGGFCKIVTNANDNPRRLSLTDLLAESRTKQGSPPPLSSTPITAGGITGLVEITEEIGLSTGVYFPKDDHVFAFTLFCGDTASALGKILFFKAISSLNFK